MKSKSKRIALYGIFAALSDTTPDVTIEALKAAKKHGTITSYDLNYRPSLWKSIGGVERAREVNREIAKYVDVMIGNEEDFTACLGLEVQGVDANLSKLDTASFRAMIEEAVKRYEAPIVALLPLRLLRQRLHPRPPRPRGHRQRNQQPSKPSHRALPFRRNHTIFRLARLLEDAAGRGDEARVGGVSRPWLSRARGWQGGAGRRRRPPRC